MASKSQRRYIRSVVLGVLALATLIWAAVDQFAISWEEMGDLLLVTLLVVAVVIGLAALVVGLWQLLRLLVRRRQE
jgi:uncharacterized membrane protein